MEKFKYLVRDLKLIRGGECSRLSLQYIEFDGKDLSVTPFDRERAGFIYRNSTTLEWHKDNLKIDGK